MVNDANEFYGLNDEERPLDFCVSVICYTETSFTARPLTATVQICNGLQTNLRPDNGGRQSSQNARSSLRAQDVVQTQSRETIIHCKCMHMRQAQLDHNGANTSINTSTSTSASTFYNQLNQKRQSTLIFKACST